MPDCPVADRTVKTPAFVAQINALAKRFHDDLNTLQRAAQLLHEPGKIGRHTNPRARAD